MPSKPALTAVRAALKADQKAKAKFKRRVKGNKGSLVGGRAPFVATEAARQRVILLIGTGMKREDVAMVLNTSIVTLSVHFAHEIDNGVKIYRNELMAMMKKLAEKGNAGAAKLLVQLNLAAAADEELRNLPGYSRGQVIEGTAQPAITERVEKMGKKDAAQLDAVAISRDHNSDWGGDLDVGAAH